MTEHSSYRYVFKTKIENEIVRACRYIRSKNLERKKQREQELKKSGVDKIEVKTIDGFVDPLISYFKRRTRK